MGNLSGESPYAYVNGNPESFSDPTGQYPAPDCGMQCSPDTSFLDLPIPALQLNPTSLSSTSTTSNDSTIPACVFVGCRSNILADTGSSWVPIPAPTTAPGCLMAMGISFGGASIGGCFPEGSGGISFVRQNNPPLPLNYCPPPTGCGDDGNNENSSDTGNSSSDRAFQFPDTGGGTEGGPESQPKRIPTEDRQGGAGEAGTTKTGGNERPVNSKGEPYPKMIDPRTGEEVPFPSGDLQKVQDPSNRVDWNSITRGEFIKKWIEMGYPVPDGGWKPYDIHHILPRAFGGTNDFWNLVPLERNFHQRIVNPWWDAFEP